MKNKVKAFILNRVPEPIEYILRYIQGLISSKNYFKNVDVDQKKIFIMLAADYGNLGDIAITEAQSRFIKDHYPEHKIIEIPIGMTYKVMPSLRKVVGPEDIITTTGGGFMGSLYYGAEKKRCYIIKNLPNNRIISFPQTITFENNAVGDIARRRMNRIYNRHGNLTLLARDRRSYNIMKDIFIKNSVYFTPDIALYLDSARDSALYDGMPVGICLRGDKEVGSLLNKPEFVESFFKERGDNLIKFDTHIGDVTIPEENRMAELNKSWEKFKSCKLVVTDRLHGMIFCVITKTPCIAINNSNGKVGDVYNSWLKNFRGVTFISNVSRDRMLEAVSELTGSTPQGTSVLSDDFDDMWEDLKKNV